MIVLKRLVLILAVGILAIALPATADEPANEVVPYNQDQAPGPALSPEEAIARMTVPQGFSVEIVAAEPDLVNPVAMTFDERGRAWMTESLEYPRLEAGEGRDRVKVLEDTDGDGRADRFTIFAEGLNIPSGIAVGYGGVWVANSPDILFLQDTDGDGRADRREAVVTGFGRRDTHELPNSLTWGPDGWLYGLNGVFNQSVVMHQGREHRFTCALWRLHPRTRAFELFAEGTSNPWGVAFDNEGSAFVSACVIDHLWHLAETGYYHRQGGPYPPFTWKLGSIVEHSHQKAAYCGIHFFDSDAYPPEFRERLYMGNIHGGCVNCDLLERSGASYRGLPGPDFLTAHDAWFMPIVQKTGPDGCLYVLDWYDRYHCYQDARRDSAGIDRLRGRLYRVRFRDTPRAGTFDLAQENDAELVARLRSPNVYFRDQAQRLLGERTGEETDRALEELALDRGLELKFRMHGLFARVARGGLSGDFLMALMEAEQSPLRAWGVRAAGDMREVDPRVAGRVAELARDEAADVQLQVAVAAAKIESLSRVDVLVDVLTHCGTDEVIPPIVWRNLEPVAVDRAQEILARLGEPEAMGTPGGLALAPRLLDRLLAGKVAPGLLADWMGRLFVEGQPQMAGRAVLRTLIAKVQDGEIAAPQAAELQAALAPLLDRLAARPAGDGPRNDALILAVSWGDREWADAVGALFSDVTRPFDVRLQALAALIMGKEPDAVTLALETIATDEDRGDADLARGVLSLLGRLDEDSVAEAVLAHYAALDPNIQPAAIVLLTQRASWSGILLRRIAAKEIPPSVLNANQARRMLGFKDHALTELLETHWGTVRSDRDAAREAVVAEMRELLENTSGNVERGSVVFRKLCAQCHKFRGAGEEVGPDLTTNGRASFDQLLSNVFDPSLVIGSAYQARTVVTTGGRAITGLTVEDNTERVVLKVQGGKIEAIPRDQIEDSELSRLSLMPEGVEKQLSPQEIVDLFVYLLEDVWGAFREFGTGIGSVVNPLSGCETLRNGKKSVHSQKFP